MAKPSRPDAFDLLHPLAFVAFLILASVLSYPFFESSYLEKVASDMRLLSLGLYAPDLESLSGKASDEGGPEFARVASSLRNFVQADADREFAYLFALRGADRVALAFVSPSAGAQGMPPGAVIGPAAESIRPFFEGSSPSWVSPPYSDRRGEWISLAVPALLSEEKGQVLAAFGLDIGARRLRKTVLLSTGLFVLALAAGGSLVVLIVDRTRRLRRSAALIAWEAKGKRDAAVASERAERDFLALMSHEIRNPLSSIVGFSLLLSETRLDGEQRSHVDMLRISSEHLMDLVNDILDFSKIEAGRMDILARPFSPARLVREAAALFSLQALRKGIELSLESDPACPAYLLGDQVRVRQILVNLLSNAVKFTAAGGVVLRLSYSRAGGGPGILRFSVEDSGAGMDAETMSLLFMPFRQGAAGHRTGGTGLGLVISKRLVDLMGGRISAGSDLGKGSVFAVELPLPPCDPPAEELEELAPPLSGLRILAADDDAANRLLVASLLTRRGARVTQAADGKEALVALLAGIHSGSLDAAVLDRSMPGMDGLSIALELRMAEAAATLPRLRLVALTASVSEQGRREMLEAGFDAVLPKPFDPDRLAEALLPHGARGPERAGPVRAGPEGAEPSRGMASAEAGLFDEAALLRRVEGDAELAAEIQAAFLATLGESLASVRLALEAARLGLQEPAAAGLAEAAKAGHKLRGSALNACAPAAAQAAGELEAAARAGDEPRARSALEALGKLAAGRGAGS